MLHLQKQEHYRARYKALRPGHQMGLEVYIETMAGLVTAETRLLDIGCGPGGLVTTHEGHAALVTGIDRYVTVFEEPAEISVLTEADTIRLPFATDSYNLVTCSWVLEHLHHPQHTFAEVARVMAPGAHFLFITPNALNYVVGLRRLVPAMMSKAVVKAIYARDEDFINPTYYEANTPRQIEHLAHDAGLDVVWLRTISDPTYLAFNNALFRMSVLAENVLSAVWPSSRVHLVGLYRKPEATA